MFVHISKFQLPTTSLAHMSAKKMSGIYELEVFSVFLEQYELKDKNLKIKNWVNNFGTPLCRTMNESVEQRLLRSEEQDSANLTSRIWTESKKIWRVAFPGMVARVTSFGIIVVTQFFLGHIGELQLAAYAIEQTFFVRFVMGIMVRFSSSFNSFSVCIYIQHKDVVFGRLACQAQLKHYADKHLELHNTTCWEYICSDHGSLIILLRRYCCLSSSSPHQF